jgi:hypothetical protein
MAAIRALMVGAVVVFAAAGCGKGDRGDAPVCASVPTPAPWSEMGYPVAGGTTCETTANGLTIKHRGTDVAAVREAYLGALRDQGWSEVKATDDGAREFSGDVSKPGNRFPVVLIVRPEDGNVIVKSWKIRSDDWPSPETAPPR